jgi:hypothetical protein
MTESNVAPNGESALTAKEVTVLEALLDAHDRAGFYMAYNAMFDSGEALRQARVATFSSSVGAVAIGANRLRQGEQAETMDRGRVESGIVTVTKFCRVVIPHGTTSMFVDPHDIANVLGLEGVRLMHDEALAIRCRFLAVSKCSTGSDRTVTSVC